MKISTLTHKHGGKILSLDAVGHSTDSGRASWEFTGRVKWDDGTESPAASIPPFCLCAENSAVNPELSIALAKLNTYLRSVGAWRNGEWTSEKAEFSTPFDLIN